MDERCLAPSEQLSVLSWQEQSTFNLIMMMSAL